MISKEEVRLAEWILKQYCEDRRKIRECNESCFHRDKCFAASNFPAHWDIPAPSPEPSKRQRIEWLRMLPDEEMLKALDTFSIKNACVDCRELGMEYECKGYNHCFIGHMDWWHEVVTLEQFREDVGLE